MDRSKTRTTNEIESDFYAAISGIAEAPAEHGAGSVSSPENLDEKGEPLNFQTIQNALRLLQAELEVYGAGRKGAMIGNCDKMQVLLGITMAIYWVARYGGRINPVEAGPEGFGDRELHQVLVQILELLKDKLVRELVADGVAESEADRRVSEVIEESRSRSQA